MTTLIVPEGTTSITISDTMYEVDTDDNTVDVDDPEHAATMLSLMGCTIAPRRAPAATDAPAATAAPAAPAAPTQNKRK